MTPGSFPLSLYRGDTYHWKFTLWSDAAKTTPVDLTGVTAKAEIREKPGGSTIVPLVCSVVMPNVINASLTSVASITVPTTGVWDLQLTYLSGDVTTVLAGSVSVTADVTDSTQPPLTRTTLTTVPLPPARRA
jgi:hypothetical protein